MGTETRVGIAAGLLIVVVASVYFFYGSRPDDDELLISSATRVTAPPKIPARITGSTSPSQSAKDNLGPDRQRRFASAGAGGKQPPSRAVPSLTDRLAGGRDPQTAAAQRRQTRPNPTAVSPSPANDAAGPPVPLRSGPSQELVEATWDHLLTPQPQNQNPLADPEKNSDDAVSRTSRTTTADRLRGPTSPLRRADRPLIDATPSALSSSAATSIAGLNAADRRPAAAWPKRHKIVEGDRLYAIAEDYYADPSLVSAILAANPQIKDPRALRIGDVILIPEPQAPIQRAAGADPTSRGLHARGPSPRAADPSAPRAKTYTVQPGDRLYTIAERLYGSGARWQEIYRLNQKLLKNDPDRLSPGMVLKLSD